MKETFIAKKQNTTSTHYPAVASLGEDAMRPTPRNYIFPVHISRHIVFKNKEIL
jgi:hypothetical protein